MSVDLRGFQHPAGTFRQLLEWRLVRLQARLSEAIRTRDAAQNRFDAAQAQLQATVAAMRPAQAQATHPAVHHLHLEQIIEFMRVASQAQQVFDGEQDKVRLARKKCQECQQRLLGADKIRGSALAAFIAGEQQSALRALDADTLARSAWTGRQEQTS